MAAVYSYYNHAYYDLQLAHDQVGNPNPKPTSQSVVTSGPAPTYPRYAPLSPEGPSMDVYHKVDSVSSPDSESPWYKDNHSSQRRHDRAISQSQKHAVERREIHYQPYSKFRQQRTFPCSGGKCGNDPWYYVQTISSYILNSFIALFHLCLRKVFICIDTQDTVNVRGGQYQC